MDNAVLLAVLGPIVGAILGVLLQVSTTLTGIHIQLRSINNKMNEKEPHPPFGVGR